MLSTEKEKKLIKQIQELSKKCTGYESLKKEYKKIKEKYHQDDLHEAEIQYHATLDSMPDAIHMVDRNLKILLFNNALIKMNKKYHIKINIQGKKIKEVYPFLSNEVFNEYNWVIKHKKSLISEEETIINNRKVFTKIIKIPIVENREVIRIVTVIRDITKDRLAEFKIQESQKRYQELFENSPISIWESDFSEMKKIINKKMTRGTKYFKKYLDKDINNLFHILSFMKITDVNQATLVVYEAKSKAEFIKSFKAHKIFGKKVIPFLKRQVIAIAEEKTKYEDESYANTIKNKEIYVTARWSVVHGYEKELSKVIISIIDLTKQKQVEKELFKAQKLESIGLMAGGIAHDFNNFLTNILSNYSIIMSKIDTDSDIYPYLQSAERALSRAERLTNQLLTFSKAGEPIKEKIDLKRMILEVTDFVLMDTDIECSYYISPKLWPIMADEAQLAQVFNNIVLNAVQSMTKNGEIKIKAENIHIRSKEMLAFPMGDYVMISIMDNGCGIEDHIQTKIYDPYFTTKKKGSGLGLALCYSIIKRHAGHIDVISRKGKGSTFIIYLPADL